MARFGLHAAILATLLSQALWAQSDSVQAAGQRSPESKVEKTTPTPVLKARTRLVIVDVLAHDKKGQTVTDLQASDFKVREDGKEQKISVFAFQNPSAVPVQSAESESLALNVFRNAPRFRSNSALNVILLDGLNTTLLNQAYVRSEMVSFLEKLPQGQPVAIYALGKELRLLQDFTTDLTELKKVIQAFKGESSQVLSSPTGTPEVPMTLQGWALETLQEKAPQMKQQMDNFAQESGSNQMDLRIAYTVSALTSLARMLAGYPGRKNLIWLTESVPVHIFANGADIPIDDASQGRSPGRKLPDGASAARTRRSYEDQLALVANLFADAQVAVYPIDARGLVGSVLYDSAQNLSGRSVMGAFAIRAEGKQMEELFEAHSNMNDIADKTGGKAYYNRNGLDRALLGDMEDGSTYYTLGYYPENKNWDGRFRKIQVSSERHDVKLRYRLGYFATDRAAFDKRHPEQKDRDFSVALDPNSPVATALQFEAIVLPPSAQTQNKVVMRYIIDPHKILFETGADGLHHAEVDCAARVYPRKDVEHPVTTEASRMEAAVKQDVFEKINRSWFPCQLSVELPPGNYYVRLAVRDNLTGILGSVNAQVTVPAASVADQSPPK